MKHGSTLHSYVDNIVAQTFFGLEKVLAQELKHIGAKNIRPLSRAVSFSGTRKTIYKANLCLRTATRILVPLTRFTANNDTELYDAVKKFDWSPYLSNDLTFAVNCVARSDTFRHSKFAGLRLKDGLVDRFRDATGKRPSVNVEKPDVRIHMYIYNTTCTISLDSSSSSLHKRGYRLGSGPAPINEVSAAGLILLSGWDGKQPFIDPMCGSGTIPIEAALIARNSAPGLLRKGFGFMQWPDYDEELWNSVVTQAMDVETDATTSIQASDYDKQCMKITRANSAEAGVDDLIECTTHLAADTVAVKGPGTLITNPPYDTRIKVDDIKELYADFGLTLRQKFSKYNAWMISSDKDALRAINMRPAESIRVYNGAIECEYRKYSIY